MMGGKEHEPDQLTIQTLLERAALSLLLIGKTYCTVLRLGHCMRVGIREWLIHTVCTHGATRLFLASISGSFLARDASTFIWFKFVERFRWEEDMI